MDIFVESMLSTRVGDDWYPGDSRPVDAWPDQPEEFLAELTRHLAGA